MIFPRSWQLHYFVREDLTKIEFKYSLLFFGATLPLILLMEIIRSVYDVNPNSPVGILPSGFNHWIPETLILFFLGGAYSLVIRKWLAYPMPFITTLGLYSVFGTNIAGVLPLALFVFVTCYFAGYKLLPQVVSRNEQKGNPNEPCHDKSKNHVQREQNCDSLVRMFHI